MPDQIYTLVVGDWRDADRALRLDGATVYPGEPGQTNLEKSWVLRWGDRDFVELPPVAGNPPQRLQFKGVGPAPEIIQQAFDNGLTLFGVIVARDLQRHG